MARDFRTLTWRPNAGSKQQKTRRNERKSQRNRNRTASKAQPSPYLRTSRQRIGQLRQFKRKSVGKKTRQRNVRPLTSEEFAQIKAEGYGRSYINKQIRKRTPMVFETYGETIHAIPSRRLTYSLELSENGKKRNINKLDIKYCFKQAHEPAILPYISWNEEIRRQNLMPIVNKEDRFHIEDRLLLECYREKKPVKLILRAGEVIEGIIDWFSNFEIKIELPSAKSIVAFRHAIYSFEVK